MTESLALKYRPRAFEDMVGQRINSVVLSRMVAENSLPQGLLFTGPRGSGKTSAARIISTSMDAGDPVEVDAASHGLVDDVRSLIESLRFSTAGNYRVVIYDEAHSMTPQAFNALLKTLEEPPASTIFILVTTEPDKIPETVKSRLMEFTFRKIPIRDIAERLAAVQSIEGILMDTELLHLISERADGSLRDALNMLDQCWRADISDVTTFLEMTGETNVAPDLILAMLTGDHSHVFEVADILSQRVPDPSKMASQIGQTLKDVLVLKAGGTYDDDRVRTIALNLEPERVVSALRMIWDLKTRVRQSSDPRANLDLVLVLITDIFMQGRAPIAKIVYTKRSTEMYPVQEEETFNKVEQDEEVNTEGRRLTLAEL